MSSHSYVGVATARAPFAITNKLDHQTLPANSTSVTALSGHCGLVASAKLLHTHYDAGTVGDYRGIADCSKLAIGRQLCTVRFGTKEYSIRRVNFL